jgi:ABC-2 type transport system permease protein
MVMSVFAVFIMTAFVANVVVRDDETGFGPIIHSTRVSRFDYLLGRFSGAFLAGCLLFLSVPLGMILGAAMPWVDPEILGPFNLGHYAHVYLLLCVPTLFVTGAGFFAIATATRSMMWTYVGVIAFLVLYLVAMGFLSKPEFIDVVALVDPFGLGAYDQATRYWTAAERNTRLPEFAGHILWNRVLWIGIALALLGLAWTLYARAARGSRAGAATAPDRAGADEHAHMPQASMARAAPMQVSPQQAGWSQLWALARFDIAAAIRSPAFIVLLGIGFVNSLGSLWYADEIYGNTIHPVTRVMIDALLGSFTIIPLIIAIYYAGELVWRDRERRMHEIIDATPAPDWAFVVPKILAISLVLFATLVASVLAAIVVQALKGYFNFELAKYFGWYVLPATTSVVMFAVLAIFMQTLVPHKTIGWMLMLVFVVAQITLDRLGFEHNLYQYASRPPTPLSDMNGQGDFGRSAWWFRAYWSAGALLLAVLAYALWRRGAPHHVRNAARAAGLPQRRQRGPHRRQRHVPRQQGDRADARHEPHRPAAGPREAPKVRARAGAAAREARG